MQCFGKKNQWCTIGGSMHIIQRFVQESTMLFYGWKVSSNGCKSLFRITLHKYLCKTYQQWIVHPSHTLPQLPLSKSLLHFLSHIISYPLKFHWYTRTQGFITMPTMTLLLYVMPSRILRIPAFVN